MLAGIIKLFQPPRPALWESIGRLTKSRHCFSSSFLMKRYLPLVIREGLDTVSEPQISCEEQPFATTPIVESAISVSANTIGFSYEVNHESLKVKSKNSSVFLKWMTHGCDIGSHGWLGKYGWGGQEEVIPTKHANGKGKHVECWPEDGRHDDAKFVE